MHAELVPTRLVTTRPRPVVTDGANALRALALAALLGGCASIGPGTVARDRYDYSDSISESWKRQMLLNIVKLRYLDPPIFVDVGQIVAGYSLETAASLGGQVSSPHASNFTLGASGKFTDRPTVTYTPLTGNAFVKALMTPLPPAAVFYMIQSGWPADGILQAALVSLNGLKNQETSINGTNPPDADFLRALELLRDIQRSGAVSLRVKEQEGDHPATSILTFRAANIGADTVGKIQELRTLLGLSQEATEFQLVFSGLASNDREVAVVTRSILHVMTAIGAQVEVPAEDVAEGRATPGLPAGDGAETRGLVRVHSSLEQPTDASVTVPYRGHWFWIDDRDLRSKRAFASMLLLFTLTDNGERENLPVLTIPAQ